MAHAARSLTSPAAVETPGATACAVREKQWNPEQDRAGQPDDLGHRVTRRQRIKVAKPLEDAFVPLILPAVVLEIRPGESREPSAAFVERQRQRQLQAMLVRAAARGEPVVPTLAELLELVVAPLYFYALFDRPMPSSESSRLVERLLDVAARRGSS